MDLLEPLEPLNHISQKHWDTPSKSRLKASVNILQQIAYASPTAPSYSRRRLFQQLQIPETSGRRIIKQNDSRRLHNSETRSETRGRIQILTERDLRHLELILWQSGFDGRSLSWKALLFEANLQVSERTVQRAMKQLHYRRCIACQRSWISSKQADNRVQFAKVMLQRYPDSEDWRNVRFSDEVHLGFSPVGRVWITRKPGETHCADCVVQKDMPKEKDLNKVHAWGAIGYNFKSPLYLYNSGNSNGKMTHKYYLDLLQKEVVTWPSNAVLEEDGDSGHGTSKSNSVRTWKSQINLRYYFNCAHSPDLAPIENAWQAPKSHLRKFAHWDEETVWELAQEGWEGLSQSTINKWVDSMPLRLKTVIESKGQMTAF